MQDKTDAGFSGGLDTLNEISGDVITLFFSEGGNYYIVKAEIFCLLAGSDLAFCLSRL